MNYNDSPTLPIDAIDYALAARAYRHLAWRWSAAMNGTPSAMEISESIKRAACGLSGPDDWVASGGYFVTNKHGEAHAGFDRKLQALMDDMRADESKADQTPRCALCDQTGVHDCPGGWLEPRPGEDVFLNCIASLCVAPRTASEVEYPSTEYARTGPLGVGPPEQSK